jgi:aldehyde dehydrogenase (NAD+)/betaine-aldehyde dehydrogenase
MERLAHEVASISIGAGVTDPALGPLISAKQRDRVGAMVERAVAAHDIVAGGPGRIAVPEKGFFFPPTVFDQVDTKAEIAQEEVFGPVVATSVFSDLEDCIAQANGTEYGLISAVWTRDLNVAHTLTEEIRSGQVYVNSYGAGGGVEYTFGGFKKSGYGREKGFDALGQFCQTKSIILRVPR